MELNVYVIYDVKAAAYLMPFFMPNDEMALRQIKGAVMDKKSDFFKHAEDYSLFRIGLYDDVTGALEGMLPDCLCNCNELKQVFISQEKQYG